VKPLQWPRMVDSKWLFIFFTNGLRYLVYELETLLNMLGILLVTKAPLQTTILEIGQRILNLQPNCNHN
jgi:hypothetical protein